MPIDQSRGMASGPPQRCVIRAPAAAGNQARSVRSIRSWIAGRRSSASSMTLPARYGAPRPPIAIRPSTVRWA
jgi:hypothetical protein